jgi:hypothetical protein
MVHDLLLSLLQYINSFNQIQLAKWTTSFLKNMSKSQENEIHTDTTW